MASSSSVRGRSRAMSRSVRSEATMKGAMASSRETPSRQARSASKRACPSLSSSSLAAGRALRRRAAGGPGIHEGAADVATAASVEGLRLVAEVAQDGIVSAAPALGPPHQLEEESPLVLDDGGVGRGAVAPALDEGAAQRQVARGDEQEAPRPGAGTPRAPELLAGRLQRRRPPPG